jgi:hypothetical protein
MNQLEIIRGGFTMAYDLERFANKKIDEDEIKKAQQRAKEEKEAEIKRRIAEAAIKNTMKK